MVIEFSMQVIAISFPVVVELSELRVSILLENKCTHTKLLLTCTCLHELLSHIWPVVYLFSCMTSSYLSTITLTVLFLRFMGRPGRIFPSSCRFFS